jgi:hypothetical protein
MQRNKMDLPGYGGLSDSEFVPERKSRRPSHAWPRLAALLVALAVVGTTMVF